MPVVLGVDVSLGRGLDLALVQDGVMKEARSTAGFEALQGMLREHRPDAVAIDAPPIPGLGLLEDDAERARLPVPPPPGKHRTRRIAEYELSRRGIGSHHTPREEGRLFSWMTAGFEAFAAAEEAGYPAYLGRGSPRRRAFEVFPYASYVAFAGGLSPGRRWRMAWRRAVLTEAGLTGLPDDAGIDVVDAACAAITGERFVRGQGSWIGDPREGVIVLPVAALEDRYHRCAPPDGGVRLAASATAPRLCECGCGLPVRRRFLPGHDAKLRASLVRLARDGAAARQQLARLGWTRFLND